MTRHDNEFSAQSRRFGNSSGIEKAPDVLGGEVCIAHMRIAVWMLENYRRFGWSEAKILENYPTLCAADLGNAWAYVEAHSAEIERAIQKKRRDLILICGGFQK